MDKIARFKNVCPFLGKTKTSTLRSLSTASSPRFSSLSVLTERATKCPVMGPALNVRSREIVEGYASIAANADVDKFHKEKGVFPPPGATIDMCPHASAARTAARMADDLAAAAKKKNADAIAKEAAAAGCPFHLKATAEVAAATKPAAASFPLKIAPAPAIKPKEYLGFNYEGFYANELDRKHQDKSYRYFNNINRLAAKFPVAHTGNVKEEVEVWCANDYLGMGNNPVVLETMQSVLFTLFFPLFHCLPLFIHFQSYSRQIRSWRWRDP
jgi:5-aminolevulinate synthase